MLTIPLDRVMELLDKASEVEVPVLPIAEDETETVGIVDTEALDEVLAEDPAYQALVQALGDLSPQELRELLALSLLARNDGGAEEWQPMVEQARAVPEDNTLEMLVTALLLTDDIEQALERLGYLEEESDEAEEEEEEDEEEEEEEVADEDEASPGGRRRGRRGRKHGGEAREDSRLGAGFGTEAACGIAGRHRPPAIRPTALRSAAFAFGRRAVECAIPKGKERPSRRRG